MFVKENGSKEMASISSKLCSSIYDLNILDKHIQDQTGNTTRFFVVVSKDYYKKNKEKLQLKKNGKISVSFKTKDTPSALYKCL
jgi:prephenate dehydratase